MKNEINEKIEIVSMAVLFVVFVVSLAMMVIKPDFLIMIFVLIVMAQALGRFGDDKGSIWTYFISFFIFYFTSQYVYGARVLKTFWLLGFTSAALGSLSFIYRIMKNKANLFNAKEPEEE